MLSRCSLSLDALSLFRSSRNSRNSKLSQLSLKTSSRNFLSKLSKLSRNSKLSKLSGVAFSLPLPVSSCSRSLLLSFVCFFFFFCGFHPASPFATHSLTHSRSLSLSPVSFTMRSVNSLRTLSLNLAKQEQRLQQRLLSSDQPPHPKEPSNDDERQRASAPTESLQSAALSRSSADNEERRGAAQTTARRKQKKSRANFKSAAPTAQTLQPARGAGRSRKALPRAMDARGSTRRSAHVSAASAAADMTARRAAPARESKQSARSASLKSRAEQRTSEPAVDRRPSRSNVMLFRSPAVAKTNEMAARKPAIQPAAAAAAQKCNSKQPPPALLRRSLPDKKSVSRSYEKSLVQKKADNAQSDAEKLAQALRAPFTIQDQGWATEKADGMVFYWHKATKTSQWRHPWMVQGGRVIWRKSTGAVGSKAVPLEIGTLVSAVYQIRPVDEAVRAAAAFEAGTSTQGDAGRPKWPKNYVVDISLSERTSQLGGKMPRACWVPFYAASSKRFVWSTRTRALTLSLLPVL